MGLRDRELEEKILEARQGLRDWLQCKDCDKWYGAEDDEYGPCLCKHARNDEKFVTHGSHDCDEREELEGRELI